MLIYVADLRRHIGHHIRHSQSSAWHDHFRLPQQQKQPPRHVRAHAPFPRMDGLGVGVGPGTSLFLHSSRPLVQSADPTRRRQVVLLTNDYKHFVDNHYSPGASSTNISARLYCITSIRKDLLAEWVRSIAIFFPNSWTGCACKHSANAFLDLQAVALSRAQHSQPMDGHISW